MNSIKHESTKVQQDRTAQDTNNIEATADSVANQDDVITNDFGYASKQELKEFISFRSLLESDGHQVEQSGSYVKCRCPFHNDRTPSFFVYREDNYAKCYGCDWHGDIFSYEIEYSRVDFKTAWKNLNTFLRRSFRPRRKAKPDAKVANVHSTELTSRQISERKKYTERLATESWLADEVCRKRFEQTGEPWKPETIRELAREGSLGWAGGALAFIYSSGTKYRDWPKKEFIWEPFSSSLWRDHLLLDAEHVYLTESETDAIAMLDAGMEQENGVAVVAASGASAFQADWAVQFTGKVVTLCFDNDEAGVKGANTAGAFIKPYASKLLSLNLGGAI